MKSFTDKRPVAPDSTKTLTLKKLGLSSADYGLTTEQADKYVIQYAPGTGAIAETVQITRSKTANAQSPIELVSPLADNGKSVRCAVRVDNSYDVSDTVDPTFSAESTAYCTISFGSHPAQVGASEEALLLQAVSACYDDDGNFRVPTWLRGSLQPTN